MSRDHSDEYWDPEDYGPSGIYDGKSGINTSHNLKCDGTCEPVFCAKCGVFLFPSCRTAGFISFCDQCEAS